MKINIASNAFPFWIVSDFFGSPHDFIYTYSNFLHNIV